MLAVTSCGYIMAAALGVVTSVALGDASTPIAVSGRISVAREQGLGPKRRQLNSLKGVRQMNRRDFVRVGAVAGASIPLVRAGTLERPRQKRRQIAFRPSTVALTPFVNPLLIPPVFPSASSYTISISRIFETLHRDAPGTTLFEYNGRCEQVTQNMQFRFRQNISGRTAVPPRDLPIGKSPVFFPHECTFQSLPKEEKLR